MPLPHPRRNERREDFLDRCMADPVMRREFPDSKQRYAVCMRQAEPKSPSQRFRQIAEEQSKQKTE